jgi:uncharacterized membrane protein
MIDVNVIVLKMYSVIIGYLIDSDWILYTKKTYLITLSCWINYMKIG